VSGFPVDAGTALRFGACFCGKFAGCVVESDRPEHEFGVADLEGVQDPFDMASTLRSDGSDGSARRPWPTGLLAWVRRMAGLQ